MPASTAIRIVTAGGSTVSRYFFGCWSKSFQLGRATTRARIPSVLNALPAASARCVSEPVPMIMTSGVSADSHKTYTVRRGGRRGPPPPEPVGVVSEEIDHGGGGRGREPHRRAHVIGEYQKRG